MNTKKILLNGIFVVLIIAVIPPIISILKYTVGAELGPVDQASNHFGFKILFSLVTTSVLFYGCAGIIYFLNKCFSWKRSVPLRVFLELILIFTFATLAQVGILQAFSYTNLSDCQELNAAVYFENILFGNTITLIVVTLIEGNYFLQH